jgi:DNA invertase Pin-like site-specific DNA recombinase
LSRSLPDLIDLVTLLQKKEVEREDIRERTKAGLTAARARGRKGGRPKGLSRETLAKTLYHQKDKTAEEIAAILGLALLPYTDT